MPLVREPAPAQLSARLTPDLPALPIAPDWKEQQRLWGHSFHPMCSYLASFPAALAHAFIARYSRPGDVVLDPFSGRGTTPLQACAERRVGVGNDLNPFAHLLTAAKVDPPTRSEADARAARLRIDWSLEGGAWEELARDAIAAASDGGTTIPGTPGTPPARLPVEVALCFHPATLGQLLFVRSQLRHDERVDRFLAASIAGILHGKSRAYLSDVMPNSFSMAPRYVRDFVARTGFRPERRDLFACLGSKLARLYRQPRPDTRGIALLGDARDFARRAAAALREAGLPTRSRLVVTSPPYLRVVKYGYYNWLRLWFLGIDPDGVDASLDDGHQPAAYLRFMREFVAGLRPVLADDAVVVLVIGDVESDRGRPSPGGLELAERVWEEAAAVEGYRLAGLARDEIAAGRKMTRIWGEEAGRATKTDALLVIAPSEQGRRRALAAARVPVDWTWPPVPTRPRVLRDAARPVDGSRRASPRPSVYSAADAADVSPRRPRGDGPARPHEEPGPRPHDEPASQLHPPAAGAPLRPAGERASG